MFPGDFRNARCIQRPCPVSTLLNRTCTLSGGYREEVTPSITFPATSFCHFYLRRFASGLRVHVRRSTRGWSSLTRVIPLIIKDPNVEGRVPAQLPRVPIRARSPHRAVVETAGARV